MQRSVRVSDYVLAAVITGLLFVPLLSFAQLTSENNEDRLRTEIRSALLSDPRSQSLSESELNGLVGALANEAEEQGVVDDYIPPAPTFATWYGDVAGYSFMGYTVSEASLYIIVLIALGLAILLLHRIFSMHHAEPVTQSSPPPPAV